MSCAGCRMKLRFYGRRALLLRKEIARSNVLLSKRVHPPLPHSRSAKWLPPHPPLRLVRQREPRRDDRASAWAPWYGRTGGEEKVESDPAPAQVLAPRCPCCGGCMFIIETFEAGCAPRRGQRPCRSRRQVATSSHFVFEWSGAILGPTMSDLCRRQPYEIDDSDEMADYLIACGSTSLIAWRLGHNTVMEPPEADVDRARSYHLYRDTTLPA
jgi:hypothetical protein